MSQGFTGNLNSLVSTNNSSTSPLTYKAVYTGTADDVKDYSGITVQLYTDAPSIPNGLSLQFSSDNTNWDITETYTVSASTPFFIGLYPKARYFRVVYTNDYAAQTVLRLQTIFFKVPITPVSVNESGEIKASIESLSENLTYLMNVLARPIMMNPSTGRMRVDIETNSGTLNVSTLTTMSQVAGHDAKYTLLDSTQRANWQMTVRNRIA
jgi:hypothetical protein